MNRYDHASFRGDGSLDEVVFHVHASGNDIDHYRRRTAKDEGVDRRDEGKAEKDNFVSRLDVDQERGELEARGAGGGEKDFTGNSQTVSIQD